ncbi:MAG: Asparagine synthetase [glutamine-hydrolyzing] 3 [Anaerolineales bacterium]|nr:Asparagine synthetase [glutamine-hydrolyzing] 3 [Anaerolineales bacterium]
MSGIVAIVNFDGEPVNPDVLRKMAEQCAYRGPDGIRYWIRGNVGMAHLALHSTPEATREIQPLLSADGNLCLTADVRVDNRPELIPLLQVKGQPVNNDSTDADLVLAAYQVWGVECPPRIIGDYAFAIWDARAHRLFCARDVFGVKSLHYARVGPLLCVASEAQQILQHPGAPRRLDEIAVADYLTNNLYDEARTLFQGVYKVAPAHWLIGGPSDVQTRRYWDIDPNFQTLHRDDDEYAAHFLEIFERAVADRLRTQGETIGVTMSGGMDSTSVAAVAHKHLTQRPGQAHLVACSYRFDTLKECDETYYSRAMRDELGIDLVYVPAENFWLLDDDEAFTPSLETPFMVEESLERHILQLFAERKARVWLTGHGGDSLVGGSSLVYAERLKRGDLTVFREVAAFLRRFHAPVSSQIQIYWSYLFLPLIPEPPKRLYRAFFPKERLPAWLEAGFARRTQIAKRLTETPVPKKFSDRARQANYHSIAFLSGVGRAASLLERLAARFHMEPRHPFLDRRLAEFMMSIPPGQTFRIGQRKYILRQAMRGLLPEVVRTRINNKTNLSSHFAMGLRFKEVAKIRELLASPSQWVLNLVYSDCLRDTYEQSVSDARNSDLSSIWFFVTLELWSRSYCYLFG